MHVQKRGQTRVQTGPDAYVNSCITEGNTSFSTSSEHPAVWVHQHAAMTFMQTCIRKLPCWQLTSAATKGTGSLVTLSLLVGFISEIRLFIYWSNGNKKQVTQKYSSKRVGPCFRLWGFSAIPPICIYLWRAAVVRTDFVGRSKHAASFTTCTQPQQLHRQIRTPSCLHLAHAQMCNSGTKYTVSYKHSNCRDFLFDGRKREKKKKRKKESHSGRGCQMAHFAQPHLHLVCFWTGRWVTQFLRPSGGSLGSLRNQVISMLVLNTLINGGKGRKGGGLVDLFCSFWNQKYSLPTLGEVSRVKFQNELCEIR